MYKNNSALTFHLDRGIHSLSKIYTVYTSIQMKCQGGVIFVHAPRLFYYPKRRIECARCPLTGNKNYPGITKLTNTMRGGMRYGQQNMHVASHISCL